MSSYLLLKLLFLAQLAVQLSASDTFLIYNEDLKLCMQLQESHSVVLTTCNKNNERQNFKWVSSNQILNMAEKSCLAVSSKSNLSPITVSSCNKKDELQKWECRNGTLVALENETLFWQPGNAQKDGVVLSSTPTSKSAWIIFGTNGGLCTKSFEALYTLEGNAEGAPCVFPFKFNGTLYAECIRENDYPYKFWCGATADVDTDYKTGYCPERDNYDKYFWVTNYWTGDHYQINHGSALTWHQARQSCQQQNAELLIITDLYEQAYITGLRESLKTDYWIGLNYLDAENGWQWMGNYPFRYFNWAPGSPSPEETKLCGSMDSENGKWTNEKCDDKQGYICKKTNSSLDAPVTPSDGFKPIKCPHGWAAYAGHCYQISRRPKTWKNALLSCRQEGGDLISIHSIEEYSFVISGLDYKPTDSLWIGLNDRKTPSYFEWSDGTTVRFTKWQRGEPKHLNNVQNDCIVMTGEAGSWADYYCEEQLGYICKKEPLAASTAEPETADPNCQKGWKRYGTYCYYIETTLSTFSEANSFCGTNKGSLTSIEDRYEQAFLTSLIGGQSEKYFWIGLSDEKESGTFNWANGESITFTHWNSDMPGSDPGCVAMGNGKTIGLWDVLSCGERAAFICKKWAEGVTVPPVPITTTAAPCPEGWSPSSLRNFCFKIYSRDQKSAKSWFEARDFCRGLGGDLASFHGYDEWKSLMPKPLLRKCWIGLHALGLNNEYIWSDGSPVSYLYSNPSLRNGKSHTEECKAVNIGYYGYWAVSDCEHYTEQICWICQIKRGEPLKPEPKDDFASKFTLIEDGWIAYGHNEYYFNDTRMSAEKAREFCKSHDGDLAVIENEEERKFLWKYKVLYISRENAFIGLILGFDRKFGWVDRTPVTYSAWAPGEPNFANDDENCVVMYTDTGLWNDINCGYEHGFICERHNRSVRSTVAPTPPGPQRGCADGWLLFQNKCFKIFGHNEEERKSWQAARNDCKTYDGNLASIPNKKVQAFLTMHLQSISTNTWIGLNDLNENLKFLWTDGSGVYYTNWANGFPTTTDTSAFSDGLDRMSYDYVLFLTRNKDNCVFMVKEPERQAGQWRNGQCDTKKAYICQKETDPLILYAETTIPTSGYVRYGNSSYLLSQPKMTWEEARRKCNSEQSELARIPNTYVQSFMWLQVLKYGEPVWIGLNSNLTNEKYKWITNQKLIYTHWASEEPKQKVACVYLDLDGHWKTGSCNETHFAACEHHYGTIPTEIPEAPGRCPVHKNEQETWVPFQSHCYRIYNDKETWPRASWKCNQLGGTLTSIQDLAELNFFLEHTHEFKRASYWIGMYINIDGEWSWQDNTAVDFVRWKEPEPRVHMEDISFQGNCVFMDGHSGQWSIQSCNNRAGGYICKRHKIIDEATEKPVKHEDPKEPSASHHGTAAKVVLPVIFLLILLGIAVYIIFKRRHRQQQITSSFDNNLYHDKTIILHNNDSKSFSDGRDDV